MIIERRRETNHYHSFHLTSSIHNLLSIILLSSQLTNTIIFKKEILDTHTFQLYIHYHTILSKYIILS